MSNWVSATSDVQYAIVKPTMAGYGKVIALLRHYVTPGELDSEHKCVILKGYYRVAVGEQMAYTQDFCGNHVEALIESTFGT